MLGALLPALIPSWRFFDFVRPSPRIEIAVTSQAGEPATQWSELLPHPPRMSLRQTLARLFWNPGWNEFLYLTACAENFLDQPLDERRIRLLERIAALVAEQRAPATGRAWLRVRISVIRRAQGRLVRDVAFVSEPIWIDKAPDGAP